MVAQKNEKRRGFLLLSIILLFVWCVGDGYLFDVCPLRFVVCPSQVPSARIPAHGTNFVEVHRPDPVVGHHCHLGWAPSGFHLNGFGFEGRQNKNRISQKPPVPEARSCLTWKGLTSM